MSESLLSKSEMWAQLRSDLLLVGQLSVCGDPFLPDQIFQGSFLSASQAAPAYGLTWWAYTKARLLDATVGTDEGGIT